MPERCEAIVFADDRSLIVTAGETKILAEKVKEVLDRIDDWMIGNELPLAPNKTEANILKGPRKREHVEVELVGVTIGLKKTLKYLSIHLDT